MSRRTFLADAERALTREKNGHGTDAALETRSFRQHADVAPSDGITDDSAAAAAAGTRSGATLDQPVFAKIVQPTF